MERLFINESPRTNASVAGRAQGISLPDATAHVDPLAQGNASRHFRENPTRPAWRRPRRIHPVPCVGGGCSPLLPRVGAAAPDGFEAARRGSPEPHARTDGDSAAKPAAAYAKGPTDKSGHDETITEPDGYQPTTNAPISILPDTVRPQLQAEDFLPFFVIPDSAKSAPAVPVPSEPGKLPPSNASYTEK
jgi:hypothetical protein